MVGVLLMIMTAEAVILSTYGQLDENQVVLPVVFGMESTMPRLST